MNIYGERAMRHWHEWLPRQYEAIDDPPTFFAELGLWISVEIARLRAEEIVLGHVMPAPEPTDVDDELLATWEPSSRPASSMSTTSFCRDVHRIDCDDHCG